MFRRTGAVDDVLHYLKYLASDRPGFLTLNYDTNSEHERWVELRNTSSEVKSFLHGSESSGVGHIGSGRRASKTFGSPRYQPWWERQDYWCTGAWNSSIYPFILQCFSPIFQKLMSRFWGRWYKEPNAHMSCSWWMQRKDLIACFAWCTCVLCTDVTRGSDTRRGRGGYFGTRWVCSPTRTLELYSLCWEALSEWSVLCTLSISGRGRPRIWAWKINFWVSAFRTQQPFLRCLARAKQPKFESIQDIYL